MFPSTPASSSTTRIFGSTQLFSQKKDAAFSPNTFCSGSVFGSPTGMSNFSGTSTSPFHHTSPSSSTIALGVSSFNALGSSPSTLVNGSLNTGSTFNCEQSHLGGQERGSRLAAYKTTAENTFSKEKLVSISAMPDYKAKTHEELRWEDYNFPGRGGLGVNSSAVKSTLPATNFFTASRGATAISSTPVKVNTLENTFPSAATGMTPWKYPGPTFTSQPIQFSPSATTATSAPSNSFISFTSPASTTASTTTFNPFSLRTAVTSAASSTTPSVSFAPWNNNPFTNPSTSLATHTSSSSPMFAPSNSFNTFNPRSFFTSPAPTTVSTATVNPFTAFTSAASTTSSASFPILNNNPFTNPSTSLATNTSSSSPTFVPSNSFNTFNSRTITSPAPTTVSTATVNPFTAFTTAASTTSSASFPILNNNPFTNPSTSLFTHTSSSSPTFAPSNTFNTSNSRTILTSPTSTTVSTSPFNTFTAFTTAASTTPSVSFAPLNNNPFTNPSTSLSTCTSPLNACWPTPVTVPFLSTVTEAANNISVSPVSSTFNPPTTFVNPFAPSTQNYNSTTTGTIDQNYVSQLSSSQVTSMESPSPASSPFGTLPPKPHIFVDGSKSKQPIQYGISSLHVKDTPAPVKYSLLTTRHISGKIRLPVRKYDPKSNAPKIPYYSDTKEIPVATYVPRENPRALVIGPEKWPSIATTENIHEEGDASTEDKQLFTILDVPGKLQQPDYYTLPQISELESKERAEPGYCSRVKDFVVGHHGYGSIKFLGETDVRKLDIETIVQFNNREVIVYMDGSKKPPVGEGLNKAAEITLLNIKCIDKKTGMQHTDGSKINKYTEMLKKKAQAQGAEFLSYDPVEGEWKFRVHHF